MPEDTKNIFFFAYSACAVKLKDNIVLLICCNKDDTTMEVQTNFKLLRKKHKIGCRKSVAKLNAIRQSNPALVYQGKMGYR